MEGKTIYNLELHEDLTLDNERTVVKRVAGGWLYSQQIPECNLYEVVFVPYNNEFQIVPK
jgi:hypothetical protein